jgi:hypothetical protein
MVVQIDKIPSLPWNPKIHFRVHNASLLDFIHTFTYCNFKILFNMNIQSISRFSSVLPFRFSDKIFGYTSLYRPLLCVSRAINNSWYNYHNRILWRVDLQVMKLLIVHVPPSFCYLYALQQWAAQHSLRLRYLWREVLALLHMMGENNRKLCLQ